MPRVHPIPAWIYATGGDLSDRIAPPYDVLDHGPKQALLARCEHNIVAVDLPVTPPKTVGPKSAYESAGRTLAQWREQNVLTAVDAPSLFAYEQVHIVNGQTCRRRGVFVNVELQVFNQPKGVFRHERTIQSGLDDRYLLMQAAESQLSPVFGVFDDPAGRVTAILADYYDKKPPDFFGKTDHDDVEHRCWRISESNIITRVQHFFADVNVFIADGHHRYTTALNYHQAHPDQPNSASCLFALVAAQDPGMIVLPTHRVLTDLRDFSMAKLAELVEPDGWSLTQTGESPDQLDALAKRLTAVGRHAMGLYDPTDKSAWLLQTDKADPLAAMAPDRPTAWRTLDVAVLHEWLIERVIRRHFGGDGVNYKYTADPGEVRSLSEATPGRLGVLVGPTPLEAVFAVSLANEVMPAKSTFFYPKLATGLVINPLGAG